MNSLIFSARQQAIDWAKSCLDSEDFRILDVETTGLGNTAQPVQIAVIDKAGNTLMNTLLKPTCRIEWGATQINGITNEMVADAPLFNQVYPQLQELLKDQRLIIYNADFDTRILRQARQIYKLPTLKTNATECAMKQFAKFYGQQRYGEFKWQRLEVAAQHFNISVEAAHNAIGDCLITLEVVKGMSQSS